MKDGITGGEEKEPIETGRDENAGENGGNDVPNDHLALEAGDEVTGQG